MTFNTKVVRSPKRMTVLRRRAIAEANRNHAPFLPLAESQLPVSNFITWPPPAWLAKVPASFQLYSHSMILAGAENQGLSWLSVSNFITGVQVEEVEKCHREFVDAAVQAAIV